jgi:arginyl-tRNA synthetase
VTRNGTESGAAAVGPEGDPLCGLRTAVSEVAGVLRGDGEAPTPALERPPRAEFGDYSSNAAMLLAPVLEEPPRAIAERLGGELRERLGPLLERVDVAGPGFLNLFLSDSWFRSALQAIRDRGERFGADVVEPAARERILVEFVSANPTGPLTVASGRGAAIGDALSRVLEFAGHEVVREYYVNDHGTQIELFGASIAAAMTGVEAPEGGYRGEYVATLAEQMRGMGLTPDDVDALARRGVELMMEQVRATLDRFRVGFDLFVSERALVEAGEVERVLARLTEEGHVYVSDGATWLRTSSFGEDKDRVLLRSSGELTYFAADIAHHERKRGMGFGRFINVLGADHHGYVGRIKAAFEALGGERGRLEPLIMQLVNVVERGERARMSKRKGEFVTLDDLMADIGVDAARFFMLQRSHDTPLDIDIDLAREQSQDNPVYYVQYAHARISSILANARADRLAAAQQLDVAGADVALEPAERALIKRLLELPEEVLEVAERRAPHRLTAYAHQVASDFHAFYRDCRVIGAEPAELEATRIALCVACRDVIAGSLGLLGVEAPERM